MINDDIVQKIDSLVSELNQMKSEYNARLQEKEAQISELISKLEKKERSMSAIEKTATKATESIKKNESQFEKLLKSSEELNTLVSNNIKNMNNVDQSLEKIQGDLKRQESYSENIDKFLSQFDSFKNEQINHELSLKRIKEDISFMEKVYENLSRQNKDLQKEQASTKANAQSAENSIATCLENIDAIQENINAMQSYIDKSVQTERKIDTFESQQQSHKEAVEKINESVATIYKSLSEIRYKIEIFERELSGTNTLHSDIKKKWVDLQRDFNTWFSDERRLKEFVIDVVQNNLYVQHITFEAALPIQRKFNV